MSDGVFEVNSTNGDTFLGGEDFDQVLLKYLMDEFKRDQGIDLRSDPLAVQRLREAAEKAKCELSSTKSTDLNLPYITADAGGAKHLTMTLTRAKYESLVGSLIDRTKGPCETALKDANISKADIDEVLLVGGMSRTPAVIDMVTQYFGREPNRGINPDEAVALGAAIQGGVLQGEYTGLLLIDVTPLSLGIETLGGVFTRLIKKNTSIPTTQSQTFTTAADGQTSVDVKVYQGEREMCADNKLLGEFKLVGIRSAPKGSPQIDVQFDIDANGIVTARATDKDTGKAQEIRIQSSGGLSQDEIESIVREAESHKEEDAKRKSLVEANNRADSVIADTERNIKEYKDHLKDEDEQRVQSLIADVRAQIGVDPKTLTDAIQELESVALRLFDDAHKAKQAAKEQTNAGGDNNNDNDKPSDEPDNTVDADFKEKQ
jgi:molecular chaperone DnaK